MSSTFARAKQRVEAEPAWLLHQYPYRETSLIVETFSRKYGRVAMVARGARRPGSQLRGVLMAFQPLQLSWFGSGELKTLHACDWQGGVPQLAGLPLMCGFYLNELLLKLLAHEDAHERLFTIYARTVAELASLGARAGAEVEPALRRFEVALLAELGFGIAFDRDALGAAILPEADYAFVPETGLMPRAEVGGASILLKGAVLQAIAAGDYREPQVMQQAKLLMRQLLGQVLDDSPLHTRQLLRDLQRL